MYLLSAHHFCAHYKVEKLEVIVRQGRSVLEPEHHGVVEYLLVHTLQSRAAGKQRLTSLWTDSGYLPGLGSDSVKCSQHLGGLLAGSVGECDGGDGYSGCSC